MPTLMGYDSDHARSLGEVGREGVAVDSLADMETLFAGHPARRGLDLDDDQRAGRDAARVLRRASPSSRASPRAELRGTIQNDILKEYIAQKEWIFPPEPSMRLVTDMVEYCAQRAAALAPDLDLAATTSARPARTRPRSSPSRSRTASPTSTRRSTRGLDVDDFAPRLSFFFNAHIDFFEEIAKYRAARRIWARELRERYGAKQPALVADALPHADGRRLADRAAARGEHRPHRARGARRRARRHAVAAHELVRRGARPADRERRPARAAHAAGDRARDRRRQHDRPARRLATTSRT